MSELLKRDESLPEPDQFEIVNEGEELASKYYEQVAEEMTRDYEKKSLFEQKIMRIVVDEGRERLSEEEHYQNPWNTGPTKERIKQELEYDFDFGMNCGGFALEVFSCIFSSSDNIEDATNNILKQFSFVKEKNDEEPGENEYVALYRHETGGLAHHFVKIDEEGAVEKDGSGPIREFEKWPESLKDAPEVAFIVNRRHDIEPRDDEGQRIYSYFV